MEAKKEFIEGIEVNPDPDAMPLGVGDQPVIFRTTWEKKRDSDSSWWRENHRKYPLGSLEEYIKDNKERWFRSYPSGTQYKVVCFMDGEDELRRTFCGDFDNIQEALRCIESVKKHSLFFNK